MARIVLGHNQVMTLNGAAIQGMRDFDLDLSGKEFDITNWQHAWTSSIVICASATVKLLIYWEENYATFASKFNNTQPQASSSPWRSLGCSVPNFRSATCR